MSKPGHLSWLKNDKITFTSLHDLNRKTWILSNEKNSLSNLVSEYSDARGTYVVQYDTLPSQAKLSLISHQTDVEGLSAQLTLSFGTTPSTSPISAFISIVADASNSASDYVTIAIPYELSSGKGKSKSTISELAIFQVKFTSGSTLTSHQRLTYLDSDCLAVKSLSDGTAFALIKKTGSDIDLLLIDFASSTYKKKSETNLADWSLDSASTFVKFWPVAGSSVFYLSSIAKQTGYKSSSGYVLTSMSARRSGSALFTASWRSKTSFAKNSCSKVACVNV